MCRIEAINKFVNFISLMCVTLFIIEKWAQRYMFQMVIPNNLTFIFFDTSKMKEM